MTVILFCLLMALMAGKAEALTQGYLTNDSGLKQGMAVELNPTSTANQKLVERATAKDANKVLGVSVGLSDSTLTLTSPTSEVFVSDSGQAKVYVSNINGEVKKGDLLAVSPLDGVLMRNSDSSQGVVGIALADFPTVSQDVTVNDVVGRQIHAKVAELPVNIELSLPAAGGSGGWLQQVGQDITGHSVAPQRVAAALIIFAAILVIEGSIAYGTIASSIRALGRNPLAGKLIRTQALRSFGMAGLFLLVGGAVISIILWL